MDGFEHFAEGHLITLFYATNYYGKYGQICPCASVSSFCSIGHIV
jgi:hypothetical protein